MSPEQTARTVVDRLQAAVDTHDPDAMAACFAPDAVLVGTTRYNAGDLAVRRYLGLVATGELLRWHLETYDVFVSTPDLLGFAAEGEVEWRDADGAGRDPFRLTVVASLDGGDWRIRHFHGSLPGS